jgi:hypothetical protein
VLHGALRDEGLEVAGLREEVAFQHDLIQLGNRTVPESRLTAWQGHMPFRYSGKVMPPAPFTPTVRRVRDRLHSLTGVQYDGVLINLYEVSRNAEPSPC